MRIKNHQNKKYLSRVVGVSGDVIEIKEGILYVNKKKESNVITLSEYKLIVKKNINLSQLKLGKSGIEPIKGLNGIRKDYLGGQVKLSDDDLKNHLNIRHFWDNKVRLISDSMVL